MEPQRQRFTTAYLTPGLVPTEELQMWPQHMVLLTWFYGYQDAVMNTLQDSITHFEPFKIKVGQLSHLSEEPVNLLDESSAKQVTKFHNQLLKSFAAAGLVPEHMEHMGNGYIPHISIKKPHQRLRPGEILTVDKLHLIAETDRAHHMRQVVGEVDLNAKPAA